MFPINSSDSEDGNSVEKENEELKLQMRQLDKLSQVRDEELMSAQFTIQDMSDEVQKCERQKKVLNQTIDKLQTHIEKSENEIADLTYRLQDALEQLKHTKQVYRSEGKQ